MWISGNSCNRSNGELGYEKTIQKTGNPDEVFTEKKKERLII
jgi:hypothetical protein